MVYIIGNKNLDVCKIGFSERPKRRIKTIENSVPFDIEIFKIIKGDRDLEHELHVKYANSKIKGEWFILSNIINDLGLNIDKKEFLGSLLICNGDYISLKSAITSLNKHRFIEDKVPFNYSLFIKNKEVSVLVEDLIKKTNITPIKKDGVSTWIHHIIFIEMCRSSGAKEKLAAYEMFLPESFRINK